MGKKRKVRSRKILGILDAEIEAGIQENQQAYEISLQKNTEEARSTYKRKRNCAKELVRKAHT